MAKPFIIDDSTNNDIPFDKIFSRGLVPRDLKTDPIEMFQPPAEMALIPRSEWDARIDEQEEQQSSLEHIMQRAGIEVLDQNGQGYCWAYSTAMTIMVARAAANQPYVRLSPHAVACKIKGFRDEGAWCGLSAKFARETGYPSEKYWPQKSMSSEYDNAATWANAAKHKITEDWVDLTRQVWDQQLTFDQVATALLLNQPCAVDFNWWGHSVTTVRLLRIEAGHYGIRVPNSWTKNWGENGFVTLAGSKAIPDGAICTRVTSATTE